MANEMTNFKDAVPTIVDFTAELQALRRFQRGEAIGGDMGIADLLAKIVTKAAPRLEVIERLHKRYKREYVPILHERVVSDPMDIDNRLDNDFFSAIVDEKSGYFAGNPMTFSFDENEQKAAELFEDFKTRVRLDDINYETTKNCAIGGYDGRLIYIKNEIVGYDKAGPIYEQKEAVKQIPAYECILLGDFGYDEPEFGVRYFVYTDLEDTEIHRVELYMPFKAYLFEGEALEEIAPIDIGQDVVVDETTTGTEKGVFMHPFSRCPLYGYENNAEVMGDAERVLALIDDYDTTMSDTSSELEANRGAYLAFFGVAPPNMEGEDDDGSTFNSKVTGTFYFDAEPGLEQDAKFITKELPVAAKEAHLDRLENNIYLFSKTPNLTEKTTGMAVSGEALRQRMMPMENKTASFERKFVSGNIRMLECLSDWYKFKYNIEFDPYKVTQSFRRKLPENLEYEAKVIEMFKDYLPMEQVYALLTFVDNPNDLARWYEEHQAELDRNLYEDDDNQDDQNEDVVADAGMVEDNPTTID